MARWNTDLRKILMQAFPGIPGIEADSLIQSAKVRLYDPGVVLCNEGAIEDTFYIILNGEVRVSKVINNEEIRLLKHLYPGDFFGEMALIHNAPRVATVITMKETEVMEIHKKDFERILQNSSSMSMAMVKEVSRRLRENDQMAIESLRVKASELSSAYQQLAEQEFARREFLSVIAHELRTPLTAANGYLQVAKSGQYPVEEQAQALEKVDRNLKTITTLVNDLLFLQEVELIFADFQPTDLVSVVKTQLIKLEEAARKNGVKLILLAENEIPEIPADPKTLERALGAVLDNAVKFSPDGGTVLIELGKENGKVFVRVKDQGVGIPKQALPRIFDRFFHIDELGGHVFGGVGLGLPIAKQVIEQHGGEIKAVSQIGEGSTFTIYLNLPPT